MANDIKNKFHVVPHPSYDSYYRSVMSNDLSAESAGVATQLSFTFLFIGQIRPYKNVELVLNTARKFEQAGIDASFIIAGRCQDKPYLSALYEAAPSNVHIREGFIPDDEIPSLIESSHALILPYDTRSSLNSGTCMLAFTFGRTVVCPSIGTLEGTPDELIYKYSYASMSEHEDRLFAKALEAYEDWHGDHDAFMKKGAQLQKATITHNSVKDIAESWNAVFEAIELDER
jgi:glycosyltransferase involved in cell wall biosynthesis